MKDQPVQKNQPLVIRTPEHRLRVFVSSTLRELAEEREAVRQAILNLRLAPVMFESGARPHPAQQVYKAYLSQSHIFIGIYWQRYGWIAPEMSISGLEDEYNLSADLPRLFYIKNPAPNQEADLTELLKRIERENSSCYKYFASPGELKDLVENDLALMLTEYFESVRSAAQAPDDQTRQPLTNVPVPRNLLVGRERELALARNLLLREDIALVTLTGPGGAGKSRLGIQIALELRDRFTDGVYLVGLESIQDVELVIPTIARTLGVAETTGGSPLADALIGFLYNKQMLLLLDNFEQVLSAASKIAALLEACPRLKLLVTSRAPLRLRAEKELPVPPLALPPLKQIPDLQPLSQYSAVQLFIQRAQGVKPDFQVTNQNAPSVAEICHRLDGLPLAIELASARIRLLSPQALLARLERRFEVLRSGTRDLPERQQTLYSAIDWSYNLLSEEDKRLFQRLSVFAGGCTFEAIDAVCNAVGEQQIEIFEALERLIDNNLVKPPEEGDNPPRLKMLESIREFALDRLIESGEVDHVRHLQTQFYLALVEQAESQLKASDQTQWVDLLDVEHDNIRAVLAWSQKHAAEIGLRLCAAVWGFWEMHSLIGEGRLWLESFIAQSPQPTAILGKALVGAAALAVYQGDLKAAQVHAEEALSIFEQLGDKQRVAGALNELGLIASCRGDYIAARQFIEQSLAIKRESGDEWSIANSLNNLGLIAGYQNDFALAYTLYQESLALYRVLDEKCGIAVATGNLGHVAMHLGRLDEACLLQTDSLQLFNEVGDKDGMTECLERFAMLANAQSNFKRAAVLFGAASVLRKEAGTLLPTLADQAEYNRELEATRALLDSETFTAAWREGLALTLEQAITFATEKN